MTIRPRLAETAATKTSREAISMADEGMILSFTSNVQAPWLAATPN
jgi:hypothetical protein